MEVTDLSIADIAKSNPNRKFEQVGETTYIAKKPDKPGLVLKLTERQSGDNSTLEDEIKSYERLKEYYPVPKLRRLNNNGELAFLALKEVEGGTLNEALKENPQKADIALSSFVKDTSKMWHATQKPMNESELVNNPRDQARKTIEGIMASPEIAPLLDKPLTINGKDYPPLRKTFETAILDLTTQTDPVMVLGHGDEHFGNILINNKTEKGYTVIDPDIAGYYSPARTANMVIGYGYLFGAEYSCGQEVGDTQVTLTYSPKSETDKKSLEVMDKNFAALKNNLTTLSDKPFLLKSYLLANLARTYVGRVHPKNKERMEPNKIAHLAIAVEQFYDS